MIRQFPSLFSVLLLLLVMWAPLPFGSVTVPFRSLLQGGVWAVLLVGLWSDSGRRRNLFEHGTKTVWGPFLSLVVLAALAWIQSLALPTAVVELVSSAHVIDGPVDGEQAGGSAGRAYLSWAPEISRVAALGWLTAAAAFLCGALVNARRERRLIFAALLVSGCFQVVYGGPRFRAGDPVIWGVTLSDPSGRLRGTFVNPNHTAFFLALVIPIVAAWLWLVYRYVRDGDAAGAGLLWFSVPVLALLLLFGGVALTQSRAGVLVVTGVLVLFTSLVARARGRLAVLGGAGALGLLLAAVLARSGDGVMRRFWELRVGADSGSSRIDVYREVLDLWSRFPLFGTGLGSFRAAFSAHSGGEFQGQWWNAHSDWLELLATGGLVGLSVFLVGLFLVAKTLWRRRRRPSRQDRAANYAILGALTAAVLHSAVDFGLAMPANQFVLALLLGIGVAPRSSDRGSRTPDSDGLSALPDPDRPA